VVGVDDIVAEWDHLSRELIILKHNGGIRGGS
jgi:hypothetical protein